MSGDLGLGGSEAGGLGDAGYGPSGPSDVGGGSGNYSSPGEMDQAAANFNFADLASALAAAEASGLQAGAYSPAVAQAIVDMMSSPPSEDAASGRGFHSPGLSYGTLAGLEQAGFGKTDIPGFSQNIEQALAAQNVHNVLNYTVPALVSMVPGYGTVSALGKGIANIHGLMTNRLTPAEVIPGLAAGLIGAKTGIPSGILEGVFAGDLGKAAGSGVQAGITSGLGPLGGLAFNLSGAGSAVNRGVSDAVSGATGGGKSGGLGGLSGAAPAPSTSTAPTGNASGDAYGGIDPETYAVTAAIEQAAQEATQPSWKRETVAGRYGPTVHYGYGV